MRYSKLKRQDLASILSGAYKGERLSVPMNYGRPEYRPPDSELWACWALEMEKEDSFPLLIIVGDDDLTSFFAWAVTFLPTFRPLTSFVRVLPWSIFSLIGEKNVTPHLENGSVFVGAILGETLTNTTGRPFMESLPLTAFESTYSYVIGRSISIGLNTDILRYVSNGWYGARELTGQKARKIPLESMEKVLSIVLRLTDQKLNLDYSVYNNSLGYIQQACREIADRGRLSKTTWDRLTDGVISSSVIIEAMGSTKENRVEAFEKIVSKLPKYASEEISTSFIVGYLASLVSDGSLEHAHLVYPLQSSLPTAMLWYGVCAGLAPNNRLLSDYSHVGLKILRRLKHGEELLACPSCDISLAELEVILRGDRSSHFFRQTHSSFLRVEIAPMVNTTIGASGRPIGVDQLNLFGDEERRISHETNRLRELIFSLRGSLSLAEDMLLSKPGSSNAERIQSKSKRRP